MEVAVVAPTVTFAGRTPLAATSGEPSFAVWTYVVQPDDPADLPLGHAVALALPGDLQLRDPKQFPGVAELSGMFLQQDPGSSRKCAGRVVSAEGTQTIALVAGEAQATGEILLVAGAQDKPSTALPFAVTPGGPVGIAQTLAAPAAPSATRAQPQGSQRAPAADFGGVLPYASELFGIYQPLGGWLGRQSTQRAAPIPVPADLRDAGPEAFRSDEARALLHPLWTSLRERLDLRYQAVFSPIGMVNLFREYFFEFDTFLGPPTGHIWISPGGTVEVVESSTRRTLVEKTAEQSEETTRKAEESLTTQDDVADAVKEDNANDTKLGVSASGGGSVGVYHAEASTSFSVENSVKKSSESTHKHSRTQSSKVASEIKRNFKTTFRTVTETTDTTSRRYVVQNTTDKLVNYELRRKMRKVGVQVQHIGTRMCWQVYLDQPGRSLGLGDLVHVVPEPDLTQVRKVDVPTPAAEIAAAPVPMAFEWFFHEKQRNFVPIAGELQLLPPQPGYIYSRAQVRIVNGLPWAMQTREGASIPIPTGRTDGSTEKSVTSLLVGVWAGPDGIETNEEPKFSLEVTVFYKPSQALLAKVDQDKADAKDTYDHQVAELRRQAYGQTVRDRLKLVSGIRTRPNEDLRREERHTVYGDIIRRLALIPDEHINAEVVRQIFDVDEMLYYTAPDYWRPSVSVHPSASTKKPPGEKSIGKYPAGGGVEPKPLPGDTVASWYCHTDKDVALDPDGNPSDEWRINYLITEETQPAPMGSSLGWLIQIDGDERRNEFLNAAWIKAVLPIRPGQELAALDWLQKANVEGEAGLGVDYPNQKGDPDEYQGKTVGQVLVDIATKLQAANTDITNTLATEKVFEHGFDPLDGGFRPADPYQVFDQWVEVLPTDQVVAAETEYDPKTGIQK